MDNVVDWRGPSYVGLYMTMAYADIKFIQPPPPPDKPWARLEDSKNPPPGTIIVHKNPHLGTKQGVKSPTLERKYL